MSKQRIIYSPRSSSSLTRVRMVKSLEAIPSPIKDQIALFSAICYRPFNNPSEARVSPSNSHHEWVSPTPSLSLIVNRYFFCRHSLLSFPTNPIYIRLIRKESCISLLFVFDPYVLQHRALAVTHMLR